MNFPLFLAYGADALVYWALAASAASAATSVYSTVQQGKSEERKARFDAQVEDNNAVSAGYAAAQENQAAAREAEALREERLRNLATQRTDAVSSGLTISGSVLDTMGDSALASEKEIQLAYYRGRMGAYNQTQRASNSRVQATMLRASGRNARTSANWQAGGTLLSTAASSSYSYANFKKK